MRRPLLLLGLLAAACGKEEPDLATDAARADARPADQRYLPLAVGRSWTYEVVDQGVTEVKSSTVEALEDVGGTKAGVMAFRVRTEKTDGFTVSWQEDLGDRVVRHREQELDLNGNVLGEELYEPYKLRVDETGDHLMAGATWQDSYTETRGAAAPVARTDTWTVEAVDEEVTVPAGTYTTLRVRRVGAGAGQSDKRYWFAIGVGKIREEGGQTERLSATSGP